ncbi:hypothetical protein A2U01_0011012, partial [Trifolium medium]|nr:hypothetical protein [Trifolium medium]
MKETQRLLARIMFGSFFPREGWTDQLSWDHRHFIYFLTVGRKKNLAAYIFNHLCKTIRSAQNPAKKTPHIAYPRLLSEFFYQCALIDRIERHKHGIFWKNNGPHLLMGILWTKEPIPENPGVHFSNEPPDVILEYMRLMKAKGIIITGADIAKVSPEDKQKKRKRIVNVKQDKISEANTSCYTSASGAEAPEAKSTDEKKATETAATEDVGASVVKDSDKGKGHEATTTEIKPATEKNKGKAVKKPRTVKKRASKVQRKMVISDSEEIEEEQPVFKRKRIEPVQESTEAETDHEKAQPSSENMDTGADSGNSKSINDNVSVLQAQTRPISSPLNQPNPDSNNDIDPSLLQPINVIHPPQISDLPNITSDTDIDTVTDAVKL